MSEQTTAATVTSKTFTDPRDILLKPVVSEKSYALLDENKYTFVVDPRANKTQIKQAVEAGNHVAPWLRRGVGLLPENGVGGRLLAWAADRNAKRMARRFIAGGLLYQRPIRGSQYIRGDPESATFSRREGSRRWSCRASGPSSLRTRSSDLR